MAGEAEDSLQRNLLGERARPRVSRESPAIDPRLIQQGGFLCPTTFVPTSEHGRAHRPCFCPLRHWGSQVTLGHEAMAALSRSVPAKALSVVLVALALLLLPGAAGATNLSSTAAAMSPGTFVEMTGMNGFNNGAVFQPPGCPAGNSGTAI